MAAALLFRPRQDRVFRPRTINLDEISDREVISKYRLNRRSIYQLNDLLQQDLSPITQRTNSVSSMTKAYLETNNVGSLLGDSGYGLQTYLLTPKIRPTTEAENNYNHHHSRGRMVIERAFGLLKSRFRCLHKTGGVLPFKPSKCADVFMACARLHNFCIMNNVPEPLYDVVMERDHAAVMQNEDNVRGAVVRQRIIDMF